MTLPQRWPFGEHFYPNNLAITDTSPLECKSAKKSTYYNAVPNESQLERSTDEVNSTKAVLSPLRYSNQGHLSVWTPKDLDKQLFNYFLIDLTSKYAYVIQWIPVIIIKWKMQQGDWFLRKKYISNASEVYSKVPNPF